MIKHTVFPFDLFPTTFEVTQEHIIITYKQIFGTSQQELIPMKEIHLVEVDSDIFFSTLIIFQGIPEKKIAIRKLWKKDAKELELAIQKILEGN